MLYVTWLRINDIYICLCMCVCVCVHRNEWHGDHTIKKSHFASIPSDCAMISDWQSSNVCLAKSRVVIFDAQFTSPWLHWVKEQSRRIVLHRWLII